MGVHEHLAGEPCVELRNSHRSGGSQKRIVLKAQNLGGNENTHGVRVVQGNSPGVDPGEILQHSDHGGVIVSQHIQLQEVVLHAVIFKMGGDGLCILCVRRVLHGGEILHIHVVRYHHKAAGVLACGAAHTHAA